MGVRSIAGDLIVYEPGVGSVGRAVSKSCSDLNLSYLNNSQPTITGIQYRAEIFPQKARYGNGAHMEIMRFNLVQVDERLWSVWTLVSVMLLCWW